LAFLSVLLLLASLVGPQLTVSPRMGPEPTTVTFLLTNIPERSRVACFVLDGTQFYGGCKDVEGRKSYRVEYKDVRAGTYQALVTIDQQQLPVQEVIITSTGPE
jgi:hypothetical protein